MTRWFAALLMIVFAAPATADEIRCAVAANFAGCLEQIAMAFENSTDHTVVISSGSTGSHYAQIRQGAPFHLYFAADDARPRLLEKEGFAVSGSRATYAVGRLVLWTRIVSPDGNPDLASVLSQPEMEHLAMADARLAPYGRAAQQVLDALGIDLDGRVVTGRSVAQAWHFVASGAADAGFVAFSQVPAARPAAGTVIPVPQDLHDPILQQAVLLNGAPDAARDLLAFVLTGPGRQIVVSCGYGTEVTP